MLIVALGVLLSCAPTDEEGGAGAGAGRSPTDKVVSGSESDAADSSSPPIESPSPTGASEVAPATPATFDTGPPQAPPTAVPPDPAAVESCLAYVQLKRFVGDPVGTEMWERSGSTDEGIRVECARLATTDPVGVTAMQAEVDEINAFLQAAATTTTTTTLPPPTAPPAIVPMADLPDGDCDPNYSGCVPIASDVDCAGGSGNGPEYVDGPVQVIGTDIYELDGRDNDGIGCES